MTYMTLAGFFLCVGFDVLEQVCGVSEFLGTQFAIQSFLVSFLVVSKIFRAAEYFATETAWT